MLPGYQLVDLTHTLDESVPTWESTCGFHRKTVLDYKEGALVYEYRCMGGAGTHIDAPSHFFFDGAHIDQLDPNDLIAPLCILELIGPLSPKAQIGLKEIESYEKKFGRIPAGSVVVGHTGWWRFWGTSKYRHLDENGNISTPIFAPEVGEYLLERHIAGIGIDTLSPDPYWSGFPLHTLLLGEGKYIIENLTNLDRVPINGAFLLALPPKIGGGTESPVRAIALIPE
jgi:kynurenine formamidase